MALAASQARQAPMSSRPELEKLAMQELAQSESVLRPAMYSQLAAKDAVAQEGLPESVLVLER
jgi:hypothetical protein